MILFEIDYSAFATILPSLFCNKFRCVFYFGLKSIQYLFQKLILGFVSNETDLHHVYVVVNCNILKANKLIIILCVV